MSGRLGASARTIQLSSDSPLTFPMAGPRHGISDAIDAAIHTDLPAHPYSGPLPTAQPLWIAGSFAGLILYYEASLAGTVSLSVICRAFE